MSNHYGISSEMLRQVVERLERLEEEKANVTIDIREVLAEAKSQGFDVKTIKQILKLRKMKMSDVEEQESLLETYKAALGMLVTEDA